ncbi:uncharacterized protein KY384_007477 [Bacidia gigantensis]|uniref:uncharacterized protein n=1 Tax=Bacidia gigantensis TaxID=2732470 RepID=UPI001D0462E7|nr:uncharacterized protein KY384_007477 [Bacidia gigantensis]KAG8527325.1 hypothetical protein KY384_007477 [Bacidia gigantensis]
MPSFTTDEVRPLDIVSALVRFLDKLDYQDTNLVNFDARFKDLQDCWTLVASHFEQRLRNGTLRASPKHVWHAMRTGICFTVCTWAHASLSLLVDMSIFWIYTVLLDDDSAKDGANLNTGSFVMDLINGTGQQHQVWRLMKEHFPALMSHYGPFCELTIFRSSLAYVQGCWIESHGILGDRGADLYPTFLRNLTALPEACAGGLFPKDMFNEEEHLQDMAILSAQLTPYVNSVNDLLSFYKEVGDDDQVNFVRAYCRVHGVTMQEALNRVADDAIHSLEQLRAVFNKETAPAVKAVVDSWMQGYVTFHFCQERYRLSEVYEECGHTPEEGSFRRWYDIIRSGRPDSSEWAKPLVLEVVSRNEPKSEIFTHVMGEAELTDSHEILNPVVEEAKLTDTHEILNPVIGGEKLNKIHEHFTSVVEEEKPSTSPGCCVQVMVGAELKEDQVQA